MAPIECCRRAGFSVSCHGMVTVIRHGGDEVLLSRIVQRTTCSASSILVLNGTLYLSFMSHGI